MDLERFKKEVLPLREQLVLLARKLLENKEEAEDSVQESLLKLWGMRDKLDGLDNLGGFAHIITKNICIDKLRAKKSFYETNDTAIEQTTNYTPETLAEQQDSVAIIRQIVESLPSLQKTIIRMRDIEGYELSEIASITATDIAAVRANLSRARKRVRERFVLLSNYYQQSIG
ncbi:RNA polymerase sigma factor [Bacteroidales bacterium OttesenSCG-928-M11]|nr:RNA polymerase sigma factor [Bacteroidales bacterium OttesenSCG-928-M11]